MATGYYPSIFNDVIGPVMRGPSSSHCAAANKIGLLAREVMDGDIESVLVSYDTNGALATTHRSQGSDMGLFGGLLGWDCRDERIVHAETGLEKSGVELEIVIDAFGFDHPNTYRLKLSNTAETHELTAISTGGGMIELVSLDGCPLSSRGDAYETLILVSGSPDGVADLAAKAVDNGTVSVVEDQELTSVRLRSAVAPDLAAVAALRSRPDVEQVKTLSPVLPVLTSESVAVPFSTSEEMLDYNAEKGLSLSDLAIAYEATRGGLSEDQVMEKMAELVTLLRESIQTGLKGTEFEDRILGYQSGDFVRQSAAGNLADGGALNRIVPYVTALMEVKSSMGLIVAAPTAGACAGLPGALIGLADHGDLSDTDVARGMLAAGMIGIFIAGRSTFAAEVAGCQAECGSASGMAAAGIVQMMGGSLEQALAAASMALQNSLGMICDPVAVRVEVPCLGKNVMAASNAFACANMALAGYDPVIPLDEVIDTMDKAGKSIPHELRCTGLGGLSVTCSSKRIERKLRDRREEKA